MTCRHLLFLYGALFILFGTWTPSPVAVQEGVITFQPTIVENNFPDCLSFTISAASSVGDVIEARFVYRLLNQFSAESIRKVDLVVEPGPEVTLSYTLSGVFPPSAPIVYYWEIADEAGDSMKTDDAIVRYDDVRFDW
jgi:hypothetical protein